MLTNVCAYLITFVSVCMRKYCRWLDVDLYSQL